MFRKKKLLAGIIMMTALCILAPVTGAKAEDNNIYTGTKGESYKVTIPSEVIISEATKKGTLTVQVSLGTYRNLNVTISSNNNYNLINKDNADYRLQYTISNEKLVFSNDTESIKNQDEYVIGIKVKDEPRISGEYEDHLSFQFEETDYSDHTSNRHKVTFDSNCSDTITTSATEKWVDENKKYGRLPQPKRDGYTFSSWNTAADGSGEKVSEETVMENENVIVYAQWTPHILTINYHDDGAEYINWNNTKIPVDKDGVTKTQIEYYGATFSNRTDGLYDSWRWDYRTGYSIKRDCWKIGRDGTKEYKDKETGDTTTIEYAEYLDVLDALKEGDVTIELYPIWIAHTYTINYDKNSTDVTGSTAPSKHTYDIEQNLTINGFSRDGYSFSGWNDKADGSGKSYTDGQSVINLTATNNATITLYAQWQQVTTQASESDSEEESDLNQDVEENSNEENTVEVDIP